MYERSKVSNSPMSRKNLEKGVKDKVSNSPMSRKKVSNSPMSRKNLDKGRTSKKSPDYVVRNMDKINYYKSLSKKNHIDMDDSSTDYTESSDDFPSPSPIKKKYDKRNDKNDRNDKDEEILRMQKRIKELEKRRQ